MVRSSPLCQLNKGCMGCCGHDFESRGKILEAIKRNTREFEKFNPITEEEFLAFRDRYYSYDLLNGVCRNLIEKHGRIHCPLHPTLHKNKDLREGHCDVNFFCKTAKEFENWNKNKQKSFIRFIESKELDNITFSLKMDNNSLLEDFEKQF